MCEKEVKAINLSDIKSHLGDCYVNTKRGFIEIRKTNLTRQKIEYLHQFATEDDTVHSREYYRFKVFCRVVIVH